MNELATNVGEVLLAAATSWQFVFLMGHIIVNFVVAVLANLYAGTFMWDKLWEVFGKKFIPYAGIYIFGVILANTGLNTLIVLPPDAQPMVIFLALEAALIAHLIDNLYKIPFLADIIDKLPEGFVKTLVKDYKEKLQKRLGDAMPPPAVESGE